MGEKATAMSHFERRLSLRHPLALEVTLHVGGSGTSFRGKSVDLSRSGIFVVISARVPEGRRVDIVIESRALGSSIATSGLVVHTVQGVGIGIRFSHQNPRTRELIGELIEKLKTSGSRAT